VLLWHTHCKNDRRENTALKKGDKPIRNSYVVLREEFDDWAVLFNPDTGRGFGLSPIGVYLWKLLDGERSIHDIVTGLRRNAADISEEAGEHVLAFVEQLTQHGLVADGLEPFHDGGERRLPHPTGVAENLPDGGRDAGQFGSGMLRYERPRLELFTLENAQGDCTSGSGASSSGGMHTGCHNGNSAKDTWNWIGCGSGTSASETGTGGYGCDTGTSAHGAAVGCCPGNSPTGNSCLPGGCG